METTRQKVASGIGIGLLVALFLGSFIAILPTAQAIYIPKASCYTDSFLAPGFEGTLVCDNDISTQWISASITYPHYAILNLTGTWIVHNVSIDSGNYAAATGHIDIWNGASWVAYKNFTGGTINTNQTFVLDTPSIPTTAIRFYGLTGANLVSPELMGAEEFWIQGELPPLPPPVECFGLGSVGLAISTILPILIGVGILLAFVGFFLSVQGKSGRGAKTSRMSMSSFVTGIIGIVVFVFIVTALVVLIPAC